VENRKHEVDQKIHPWKLPARKVGHWESDGKIGELQNPSMFWLLELPLVWREQPADLS
jgi:hypothetical protein